LPYNSSKFVELPLSYEQESTYVERCKADALVALNYKAQTLLFIVWIAKNNSYEE